MTDPEEFMLRQWRSKLDARPDSVPAMVGIGRSLAALGRIDELLAFSALLEADRPSTADWVLRIGSNALPSNLPIGLEYCRIAARQGNEDQALKRWGALRRRQQAEEAAHVGLIEMLLRAGKLAEAERAAAEALDFLGARAKLREMHAVVAEAAGDWRAAAERWEGVSSTAPGHPDAVARADAARNRMAEPGSAGPVQREPVPVVAIPPVTGQDREEIKALLMRFESLGSNCELGLLQRQFGAEPLGLLRFSLTLPRTVLALLRSRFAGLGDPAAMRIVQREGISISHAYSNWSTHVPPSAVRNDDPDKMFREQCRHASFLRKKLITDLERQSKIFVYKHHPLAEADLFEIYDALQDYGPNILLYVRPHDASLPPASVTWPRERLMVAAIDRYGDTFRGGGWNISVDYWVHFCRLAAARWDEMRNRAI